LTTGEACENLYLEAADQLASENKKPSAKMIIIIIGAGAGGGAVVLLIIVVIAVIKFRKGRKYAAGGAPSRQNPQPEEGENASKSRDTVLVRGQALPAENTNKKVEKIKKKGLFSPKGKEKPPAVFI